MSTPELALEYVRALVWPVVAVAGALMFRAAISDKIGRLKTLDAGPVKTTFDNEAQALEVQADKAVADAQDKAESAIEPKAPAKKSPAKRGAPVTQRKEPQLSATARAVEVSLARHALEGLAAARDFDVPRRVAVADPNAAVMSAYRQVEQGLRSSAQLLDLPIDNRQQGPANHLAQLNLDAEFESILKELRRLRDQVTHSVEDVTAGGALAYIAAAERLMEAVYSAVVSRLRHPSQYERTARMFGLEVDD